MIIAKKNNESKVVAKEIGLLLKDSKEELARIKVEHIIRNKNDIHALEIIQLFCDLLLARHLLLESEQSCPVRAPPPTPPLLSTPTPPIILNALPTPVISALVLLGCVDLVTVVSHQVEMQEAVFSVCWAASRTEVPELMQVRMQFILKYPLDFGLDPVRKLLPLLPPLCTRLPRLRRAMRWR